MENKIRPSWDEFFIAIATIYSSRGSCDRLRTACVLVNNKRIAGAGYNGSIVGQVTCDEADHDMYENHCVRTLHGERNAITNSKIDLNGATAYIIATPCLDCTKMLLQEGVSRIVYVGAYSNAKGKEFIERYCNESNASLEQWTPDPAEVAEIFRKIFERLQGPGGIFKDTDLKKVLFPGKIKSPCGEKK